MAMTLTRLKPVELIRIVNSTQLGEVLNERRLRRHRASAGTKICDDAQTVNLVKYAAWLTGIWLEQQAHPAMTYEQKKEATRNRNMQIALAGRDIGELPEVAHPETKEACRTDFRKFCETYFPETFSLAWSPDHLKAISRIETAVLQGGLFALAMPRGTGKALALDTPLPTPGGWTTMGDVKVGDLLFDEQGRQCRVVLKSEVFTGHDCYRVTFTDGESIVCDAGHLWQVEDIYGRKNPYVRTTEWLASRTRIGKRGWKEHRFRIPLAKPLQIQENELPFAPYALGVWLGDGDCACSRLSLYAEDKDEISHYIKSDPGFDDVLERGQDGSEQAYRMILKGVPWVDYKKQSFQARLRQHGLIGNKHIPKCYLRASCADRLALLQGIMDTDGHADRKGHCEICIKYPQFARDFAELLSSLGIKFGVGEKYVELEGKAYGPYKRFFFTGYQDQHLFRLKRKQANMRIRPVRKAMKKTGLESHTPCDVRSIDSIEHVDTVPTQCVMVDSPSHLYLAGRRMVPTHNTQLSETAAVWAMLYGHREFVTLIGATETAALEMLDSIKTEFEVNEHLEEDFPEVIFPIKCLDGIANRCAGQLYKGQRTRITWTSNELVLPTIAGSPASGVIVRVAGITGRVRGMKYKRADGRSVRPSLVIVDDPQTTESAGSIEQTRKRVRVLAGDILGLAGPGEKIAGIMPCTIIRPGDMAEQLLDRKLHPEWNGERTKLIYEYPKNTRLWEEYADIRADSLREDGNIARATEFYREHQAEMDEGAVVAWDERYNFDEASAVQYAMDLKLQDETAFQAEYQNDPLPEDTGGDDMLSSDEIASKVNGLSEGTVPLACDKVTCFIDIQKTLLYYAVVAWADDFTGAVVEYGAWPEQRSRTFSLASANPTIQDKFPNTGLEGCLYGALEQLTEELFTKEWRREDGAMLRIERAMIDANWGASTDVVYQFCRQCKWGAILCPAHGRYVGASSKPMTEYRRQKGDRLGFNWMMPSVAGKRAIRHCIFDSNFWKSFVHTRLAVPMGDRGCLSFWGRRPDIHQLMAEHLTAEYRVKTSGRGRIVDEWKLRPDRSDNHWLDCLAGCAVCGSMQGSTLPEFGTATPLKRRNGGTPMKLSDVVQHGMQLSSTSGRQKIRLSDLISKKN